MYVQLSELRVLKIQGIVFIQSVLLIIHTLMMLTGYCACGCRIKTILARFLERKTEGALRRVYIRLTAKGLPEELKLE